MIFQSRAAEAIKATVASEAAIATNLTHSNVVATYGHDVCGAAAPSRGTNELAIYKFYLFQVRTSESVFLAGRETAWERSGKLSVPFDAAAALASVHRRVPWRNNSNLQRYVCMYVSLYCRIIKDIGKQRSYS